MVPLVKSGLHECAAIVGEWYSNNNRFEYISRQVIGLGSVLLLQLDGGHLYLISK